MIIACATNQGLQFVSCHFGDAEKFYIYEIKKDQISLLEIIDNRTEPEDSNKHADPKKAKGITALLKKKHVQVVMARFYGPNIKRIVQHFVPVIAAGNDVQEGLHALMDVRERIEEIVRVHDQRTYFSLKNNREAKINVKS